MCILYPCRAVWRAARSARHSSTTASSLTTITRAARNIKGNKYIFMIHRILYFLLLVLYLLNVVVACLALPCLLLCFALPRHADPRHAETAALRHTDSYTLWRSCHGVSITHSNQVNVGVVVVVVVHYSVLQSWIERKLTVACCAIDSVHGVSEKIIITNSYVVYRTPDHSESSAATT